MSSVHSQNNKAPPKNLHVWQFSLAAGKTILTMGKFFITLFKVDLHLYTPALNTMLKIQSVHTEHSLKKTTLKFDRCKNFHP